MHSTISSKNGFIVPINKANDITKPLAAVSFHMQTVALLATPGSMFLITAMSIRADGSPDHVWTLDSDPLISTMYQRPALIL